MTRRIALAILISVCVMLLLGSISAYLTLRSFLLAELDAALYARAIALPELAQPGIERATPQYDWYDSYTIRAAPSGMLAATQPVVLSARVTSGADGRRHRMLTILVKPDVTAGGPVIVEYSGGMERMDRLLARVRLALGGFVLLAGAIAGGVAVIASRLVLRPLASTARLLERIDAQALQTRVPEAGLPTELTPLAHKLNDLLARLETLVSSQREFVAGATAELCRPIDAIRKELSGDDADGGAVARARAQLAALQMLVERLGEYVSGQSPRGDGRDAAEDVDVGRLLAECVDSMRPVAQHQGIEIVCRGPAALWCHIRADAVRRIAQNLIENALDHTRSSGKVHVSWLHDGQQFRLHISDEGVGIAPEHLPHILKPFYRLPGPRERESGLGLAIVQSYLAGVGGRIRVDSKLHEGTSFDVEIPCQIVRSPAPALA